MPVNSRHPSYVAALPQWARIRDFCKGRDAVKKKETTYLPRPDGLESTDYTNGYLKRAPFFAAAAQAAAALSGTLTRKAPTITGEPFKDEIASNVDLCGTTLESFIARCTDEMFQPARFGVLVDRPSTVDVLDPGGNVVDQAPPEREHDRPYWALYLAESIINWGEAVDAHGLPFTTFVVLEEMAMMPNPKDSFTHLATPRWRVLRLDEQGRYVVDLWRCVEGKLPTSQNPDDFEKYQTRVPTMRGEPLDAIPFEVFNPRDRKLLPDVPVILKVVDANWDWYMRAADWVHALHYTANPLWWAQGDGLSPDMKDTAGNPVVIKIGSSRILTLPPSGSVGVAEVTGAGAECNLAALREFEQNMAHLSAQMMAPEKRAAEAAATLEIRTAGQTATLNSIARTMSAGFTALAQTTMNWLGADETVVKETAIAVNTDFVAGQMDPQEMASVSAMHDAGQLTDEDLFWNLDRGERVAPGQVFEGWNALRESQRIARAPAVDADEELGSDDEEAEEGA